MKRIAVVLAVLALATVAFAQDAPKGQFFGGYQLYSFDTQGAGRLNFNGFDFDVAGMVKKNIALVGDISGTYKSGGNIYTFMGGPRFAFSENKVKPFAEVLVGGARFGGGTSSDTRFSLGFGGGIDVAAKKNIDIRLAKFDYMWVRAGSGVNLSNLRYAAGIVFNF